PWAGRSPPPRRGGATRRALSLGRSSRRAAVDSGRRVGVRLRSPEEARTGPGLGRPEASRPRGAGRGGAARIAWGRGREEGGGREGGGEAGGGGGWGGGEAPPLPWGVARPFRGAP